MINLLRDQIEYLKNEIIHKNTLIEQLIIEISKSKNVDASLTFTDDDNSRLHDWSQSTSCNHKFVKNSNCNDTITSDDGAIHNTPLNPT